MESMASQLATEAILKQLKGEIGQPSQFFDPTDHRKGGIPTPLAEARPGKDYEKFGPSSEIDF